jgi:hypothetical protein
MKDVQARGQAFSPQNMNVLHIFQFLRVIFALLDPDLADQNQSTLGSPHRVLTPTPFLCEGRQVEII